MSTIAAMLADFPPLSHLGGAALESMAHYARIEQVEAGERILQTGNPADTLYVVRHGRVAIEVVSPRGGSIVIETLGPGELLGVSWMLPPYRLTFDARCLEQCGLIAIDAHALRAACDDDPALGYALYKELSGVVRDRLQATRMQLLDLYGGSHGA